LAAEDQAGRPGGEHLFPVEFILQLWLSWLRREEHCQ
jgi:hypothetical protein